MVLIAFEADETPSDGPVHTFAQKCNKEDHVSASICKES
jgi:hypothetical protein